MRPDEIQIYVDKSREFRWRRTAPNGRIISESGEGYSDLPDCLDDVLRANGRAYTLAIKTDLPAESLPVPEPTASTDPNPPQARAKHFAAGMQHLPGMTVRRMDEPTFGLPRHTEH